MAPFPPSFPPFPLFLRSSLIAMKTSILVLSFMVLLAACAAVPPKESRSSSTQGKEYLEWKRQVEKRSIDTGPLKAALLEVGGRELSTTSVLSQLPKNMLLYADNPGVMLGYYVNGIAGGWGVAFHKWCRTVGGYVRQDRHHGGASDYARAVSETGKSYFVDSKNGISTCFDSMGYDKFSIFFPIAEVTFIQLSTPSATNQTGYLIVQTSDEMSTSSSLARAAEKLKNENYVATLRQADEVWDAAWREWGDASRMIRKVLKPGDDVVVVQSVDGLNIPLRGLVVAVQGEIAQIQFSGSVTWVKRKDIFVLPIPKNLYCRNSTYPRKNCLS